MADSSDADPHPTGASLFKMPMAGTAPSISKKSASAFSENEEQTLQTSPVGQSKDNDETNGLTDSAPKFSETSDKPKKDSFSPAERLKESENPIPYKEPAWGGITDQKYFFEAIKNGIVAEKVDLTAKSYYVFGRLPSCDHTMDHPSLSRYHAIVQYRSVGGEDGAVGWYLYDLDSTHGTWINKHKVKPRVFNRLRVGYVVKFGGSTRLYILHGPDSDQDEEAQLSVTELKEQRERQKKETEVLHRLEMMEAEEALKRKLQAEEDKGCSWGMDADDPLEEDDDDNPFAMPEPLNEDLYVKDPKKSLTGFFEREGYDAPEFDITDEGKGRHRCRVELPIETASGEPEYVEVVQEGKKKDVIVACALEACRMLDRKGLFRQSKQESRAHKKKKNWEEADYYDSDDDSFLDRTGAIEKKREMRMQLTKKSSDKVETYDSLNSKLNEVTAEMESIEKKLEQDKAEKQAAVDDNLDELDAFMMSMKSGGLDTKTKIQLKHHLVELRQQKLRLERLIAVAQPCKIVIASQNTKSDVTSSKPPMVGKMKRGNKQTQKFLLPQNQVQPVGSNAEVEEEEEEEEEEEKNEGKTSGEKCKTQFTVNECDKCEDNSALGFSSTEIEVKPRSTEVKHIEEEIKPQTEKKRKDLKQQSVPIKKAKMSKTRELSSSYSHIEQDDDYAMWLRPSSQSGDGKTNLNEKFGY